MRHDVADHALTQPPLSTPGTRQKSRRPGGSPAKLSVLEEGDRIAMLKKIRVSSLTAGFVRPPENKRWILGSDGAGCGLRGSGRLEGTPGDSTHLASLASASTGRSNSTFTSPASTSPE